MEPDDIVVRVSDGHTNKDRCADCKKYKGKYFFLHCYDTPKWIEFLHDPIAAKEPFMTTHPKKKDERKLLFEGQPPINLVTVPSTQYPHFILSFIDQYFGKKSRILCTVWTIKP
jgi:hypothetical protein